MSTTKSGLMIWGVLILLVLSLFCGHFEIGVTGGIAAETALPTGGGWDLWLDALTWFLAAITFSLPGYGVLSIFIWFICAVELWGLAEFIRGV